MKKQFLLCVTAMLGLTAGYAQTKSLWATVTPERAAAMGEVKPAFSEAKNITLVTLDVAGLKTILATAPQRFTGQQGVVITLPAVDGTTERFKVVEASNFSPALQAQFPEIRSYSGQGIDDPTAHVRLSISPAGVQTMVLRADKKTEFIEPYTSQSEVYALFNSGAKRKKGALPFTCTTQEDMSLLKASQNLANKSALSNTMQFKTLRLALSCTGEYGAYFGGATGALAAMNATMTRVNGVYELDLAVNLIMIDNETDIIYTTASSDPYSNASSMGNWNDELQATLTSVIGEANYDIGHLFGKTGGGGNAGCIGCVCTNNQKGSGITSPSDGIPEGDTFDIDYVAHEMGHQLGANHSFTFSWEGTGTAGISAQTEPGSGSTIMGYAGITGTTDIQAHSDDYFTYSNLYQIQYNLSTKSCPVTIDLTNADFTVDAGSTYSIPKGTAFVLTAANTANNPSNITYCWEQNNPGSNSTSGDNSFALTTKTAGPIFRSLPPTSSPTRYFPAYSSVLSNTLTSNWESVSGVARTLIFTLTGRDNADGGGQTKYDNVNIVVKSVGPFQVTSQNDADTSWALNSQQTVTWDVAGTTANNINVSQVNILLSTDGGETWAYTLASATDNDGSETITVPSGASGTNCRIMVQSVGNVFYALNQKNFPIGYTVVTNCNTFTNSTGLTIPDNGSAYTSQTLAVSGLTGTISAVNVYVNATHTYVSDLIINAVNPAGTSVSLWNQQCTSNQDIDVTFSDSGSDVTCDTPTTGTYKPQSVLSAFNNATSLNGNWRLRVRDTYSGDTGTINNWSLEICTQQVTAAIADYGLTDFTLYPNPNNGSFTVQFTSQSQNDVLVMVHDIRGRLVYNNKFDNTGLVSGTVNLNNAEQGVYLVTVQDGNRSETRKVVVK
ncbi:reprolysin-like metallopeptidase [Flavobacterium sp. RHBU_3]|uniref:zinc-dependent metalloprotease n=1 Tax=Flavobacterium sp. RHBU_3 TaxID=3391184 RepID=UPI003984F60C